MDDTLHFMMGQYKAQIPTDRHYSKRHMWLQLQADNTYRVGFTDYSIRLLQDVYFLEWSVDEGAEVRDRQEIGEIESSKAVSSMYTPCRGQIIKFNQAILNDPALINTDNHNAGFLYTLRTTESMLTPAEYVRVLEDGWEQTQRTIKGQLN
jgi:glycine cleavage system H protein